MIIKRFRLQGFKSFAEATEVTVGKGMTGIVGPNGCGKSNLIEALRWGVGETSFKAMRAENGMEDLIFAGTQTRPPRNSAEVVITLDNSARLAPVEFNGSDTLEVSRRMERGDGSTYRVNGKTALARDVQVLFKDAGFGAKSSAIVSQGKVAAIINAKPLERHSILDEAAGTSGLSSRRHEADIRLRGTEQNLERAESMEKGLSDQLSSLRRQARQAARRREIDGLVRRAEATAFLVRWKAAEGRLSASSEEHSGNEEAVKTQMLALAQAAAALAKLEAEAAPLAKARSEAETRLALAKVAADTARLQRTAARSALQAAQKNAARVAQDLEKERAFLAEADGEYIDLREQLDLVEDDRQYDAEAIGEAAEAVEEARLQVEEHRARLDAASGDLIRLTAEVAASKRALDEAKSALAALSQRKGALEARRSGLLSALDALPALPADVEGLELEIAASAARVDEAENRTAACRAEDAEARAATEIQKQELRLLEAELKALSASRTTSGISSAIKADPGYEEAAVLALRDGLSADLGASGNGGDHWAGSDVRCVPPAGTQPLRDRLSVPEELEAAISGIGIARTSESLPGRLAPGQAVILADGTMRRWDGLVSSASAAAAEEIRRMERGRVVAAAVLDAKARGVSADHRASDAATALAKATAGELAAREELRERRSQIETAIRQNQDTLRRRNETGAQIAAADETLAAMDADLDAASARVEHAAELLEGLGSPSPLEAEITLLRRSHADATAVFEARRTALDGARRAADGRTMTASNIRQKLLEFDRRLASCRAAIAEHLRRQAEVAVEIAQHEELVALAPEREAEAMELLEDAAALVEEKMAASRETDARLAEARDGERRASEALAVRKEARARILAELKAHQDASAELSREIGDRLSAGPDALAEVAGVEQDAELPALEACEARTQRLLRERDTLGSVNLLADEQLKEVEARLGEANKIRDELREAVRRLRDTISKFDQERRERLTEAFASMDRNFQDLFARLFRGGQAYLKLSGSDDILEAGLEIYAAPPGKKLQSMSLLSGGEQALTALAMVFAAFLIRPAPVCVLDEVDAALDDANVERMCSLVSEMSETTRFLVITHRAITMSRCNQLYGVTMAERGVSRLASLDMEAAVAFVESFGEPSGKD